MSRTAEFMLVTPAMAQQWLLNNINNRNKRGWWATAIAQMIKRGEWITTHQGIAFDKSGVLIDGQHRLEAIVESGIPIEILVVKGLPIDAFMVLDNGVKRSMSDLTGISNRTSEVCRLLARLVYSGSVNSAEQCLSIYNSGAGEICDNLVEYCGKAIKVYSSAAMKTAAVCMIMDGYNAQYIKDVYANLCHQKFNDLPNAAQVLIRQVNDHKINPSEKSDVVARGLKVFNPAYANVTRLTISDAEKSAANEYCRNVIRNAIAKSPDPRASS
jgi:hypothetical protein